MDTALLPFSCVVKRADEASSQAAAYAHLSVEPSEILSGIPCAIQEEVQRQIVDGHAVPVTTSYVYAVTETELLEDDTLVVISPMRTRTFTVDHANAVYDEELGVLDHWELLVRETKFNA